MGCTVACSDSATEGFGCDGATGAQGSRFGKAALVLVGEVLQLSSATPR